MSRWDYLGWTGSHSSDTEPEKCCDEEKVAEGRSTLKERFKREKANFDKKGVTKEQLKRPEEGGEAKYSCWNLNSNLNWDLAQELAPGNEQSESEWSAMSSEDQAAHKAKNGIPVCWNCDIENRGRDDGRNLFGWMTERDHWAVVCEGRDQDGNVIDEATFDLWDPNAEPGQDPDAKNGFQQKYPHYYKREHLQVNTQKCGS